MTIGAGIAVAGLWFATAFIVKDKRVTGTGMMLTIFLATLATIVIAANSHP